MVKQFIKRIFKLEEPSPAPNMPVSYHSKRMSTSGTEIFSGYAAEEYLTELRGFERAKIFDRMRRSDPQVRMLLNAVKNPIRSACWEIQPADDSQEAKDDAELIKYILLDKPFKPFKKVISDALTMLDFGHAVFEKTYKLIENDPKYGMYHGLASLGWINPKTIHRFNVEKDSGALASITQFANGDLANYVDVPAEYLMLLSLDQEGSNFEGISWLRPCYGSWFRKYEFLKLNAIGIERFAVKTPIVKVPSTRINSEAYNNLIEALQAYTSGESNFIAYPNDFEVDLGGTNQYDPAKVDQAVQAEDTRMAKSFLANFLELGTGSNGGAYALSNDFSDFFLSGISYVADEICDVFNTRLIPECVEINRGPRAGYPKLKHFGINDKAGKELAEILGILVDKKVIIPDDPLEDVARKRFGLPERSDQGQREIQPPPPPMAPPGAPQGPSFGLSEKIRNKIYGKK